MSRLPKLDRVELIVVHQLATIGSTLWLRLLGKNGTQNQAIQELVTASSPSPLWANIEDILANYRSNLESSQLLKIDSQHKRLSTHIHSIGFNVSSDPPIAS